LPYRHDPHFPRLSRRDDTKWAAPLGHPWLQGGATNSMRRAKVSDMSEKSERGRSAGLFGSMGELGFVATGKTCANGSLQQRILTDRVASCGSCRKECGNFRVAAASRLWWKLSDGDLRAWGTGPDPIARSSVTGSMGCEGASHPSTFRTWIWPGGRWPRAASARFRVSAALSAS